MLEYNFIKPTPAEEVLLEGYILALRAVSQLEEALAEHQPDHSVCFLAAHTIDHLADRLSFLALHTGNAAWISLMIGYARNHDFLETPADAEIEVTLDPEVARAFLKNIEVPADAKAIVLSTDYTNFI